MKMATTGYEDGDHLAMKMEAIWRCIFEARRRHRSGASSSRRADAIDPQPPLVLEASLNPVCDCFPCPYCYVSPEGHRAQYTRSSVYAIIRMPVKHFANFTLQKVKY
jgi:hypothetical protein